MRAFNWLTRLRKSERGNVLVVGAASLPLLMGATAIAVDTIQLSLWKQQLQRAADSGAIAGAYAVGQGASQGDAVANDLDEHIDNDIDENETPILTAVDVDTGTFAEGTLSDQSCADRGVTPCFGRVVQVALTSERTLPFMSLFTGSPTTLRAQAVAAVVNEGEYCMISLYDGTDPGITAGGNGSVTLGCGMATNSRAASAIISDGSSDITATPAAAVGGVTEEDNNFVGETMLLPYSTPFADPLARVPNPDPLGTCVDFNDSPQTVTNLEAGDQECFNMMTVQGTLNLGEGIYYINGGDLTVNSTATITGENVTIVMTGPGGQAGTVNIMGGAEINLTAPSTGPYRGVAFYRDRRASLATITLNGGATLNIQGALYFPTTDLTILGNFELDAACLQMVGRILNFGGTTDVQNECPAGSGSGAFQMTRVRLVG
ncbi:MAG TPA: pilus assembly protein TadG-related protein [Allosphingosinicella sp.]|nr:pilus assembly protein TadG-related protein [Allosphingosinicella sp.]